MEDSGIDSDEKVFGVKNMEEILCNTTSSIDYLKLSSTLNDDEHIVQKQPKANSSMKTNENICNDKVNHINSCKVLQRKLEMKVEKAKKNYSKVHDIDDHEKRSSSSLIPINRLPIPNRPETQPLVEYKSENSDDDDDGHTFFPIKLNTSNKRIDMSDTFSLQEMTIESNTEDDDDDAQNLELRFADPNDNWLNKLKTWNCWSNC
uniref:CSON011059 protein n=1 Tax=Culicoides sonorensis TaxID=179676 RepID=A0A336KIZ1_CULSO